MRIPTFFVGHGSPMNAIEVNNYTRFLNKTAQLLPRPKAILAISAHWVSEGTKVLDVAHPKTIHDFGGFPDELYQIQCPAMGAQDLAQRIIELSGGEIVSDNQWGLDHGSWAVLRHLYPKADIPVLQLSLDSKKSLEEHFILAQKLRTLRDEGILILGSGNVTHNLRKVIWKNSAAPVDWALSFDLLIKNALLNHDTNFLLRREHNQMDLWQLAHPTIEHYVPLVYIYGASYEDESPEFLYEGMELGSLSMRSFLFK